MHQKDINSFQSLFDKSQVDRTLETIDEATEILADHSEGDPSSRIFQLVVTTQNTGLSVKTLRDLEKHFTLAHVIDGCSGLLAETLCNISACIPGVAHPNGSRIKSGPIVPGEDVEHVRAFIKDFSEEGWSEVILIGRSMAMLRQYPCSNAQSKAVADAATRLKVAGFAMSVELGAFQVARSEMERITARIETSLRQFGIANAVANVIGLAADNSNFSYEQFLFGRRYGPGMGYRAPSIPIGFLYNLAVKAPEHPPLAVSQPHKLWQETIELARNFLAVLDLEPYTQYTLMSIDALSLEGSLRRIAQFDHCFSLRQWQLSITSEFLKIFFEESFDGDLERKFGWNIIDVILLVKAVSIHAEKFSKLIPTDLLTIGSGLTRERLYAILPFFYHNVEEVNRGYRSPFDTSGTDVIFKPMIRLRSHKLLLPSASLLGPAFFEAVFISLKNIRKDDALAKLRGDGTERLTKHVFRKQNLDPTFENAKYNMPGIGVGECDLVFEDENNIFLIECKAKALTRGSMTGVQGDALMDFAGGLFASQAQALRHERILRAHGNIIFDNGDVLEFKNRQITRISVTLMDHGALQDRWMLHSVHEALLSAQVSCDPGYKKKKQVADFNANLKDFQDETRMLIAAGQELRSHVLNVGSASIPQIDIVLNGVKDLSEARTRLTIPMTYSSYNVLFEYFQYSSMKQKAAAEEAASSAPS